MKARQDFLDDRKDVSLILGPVRKHVLAQARKDKEKRRADVLHPSEMCKGDWCVRATALRILGHTVPEERRFEFRTLNNFNTGHSAHAKWQRYVGDAKKLWGLWKCLACEWVHPNGFQPPRCQNCNAYPEALVYDEVVLSAIDSHLIQGRTDGCLPEDRCLIEIKTIGTGTVRWDDPALYERYMVTDGAKIGVDLEGMWRAINRPFTPHLLQGSLYLWLARQQDIEVDEIAFIYELKDNGDSKEFRLRYNPRLVEPLLAKAQLVKAAVDAGRAPACVLGGCKHCEVADVLAG